MLQVLASDQEENVRRAVAGNPHTPVKALCLLASDQEDWVRQKVAENPQMPEEMLAILAADPNWRVRQEVAENPQTPGEVLCTLASDRENRVRWAVARNQQASGEMLQVLASDQEDWVRRTANFAQRLRVEVETPLPREDWEWFIHALFGHFLSPVDKYLTPLSIPSIVLKHLAASPSWEVRYQVALHEKTPWATRQRLSQDGNRYVRAMARAKVVNAVPSEQVWPFDMDLPTGCATS